MRIRPFSLRGNDESAGDRRCVYASSPNTITLDTKPDGRIYAFDHVADETCSQERSTYKYSLPREFVAVSFRVVVHYSIPLEGFTYKTSH